MKKLSLKKSLALSLGALALVSVAAMLTPTIIMYQAQFWQDRTGSKTLWVDTFGNDNTAIRGRGDLPWRTLDAAATNALAGDTIQICPGIYNCTTNSFCPRNGGIKGSGISITVLLNSTTNVFPLISLTDNSKLSDLTVSNTLLVDIGSTNFSYPAQAQVCWGGHSSIGPSFTNALLQNLKGIGETDVEFVDHTNTCSWTAISCVYTSHWDTVALKNGAHVADYYNCIITPRTNAYASANNRGAAFNNQSFTGRVRVFNSRIETPDVNAYYVRGASGACSYEFYNCSTTNGNPSGDVIQALAHAQLVWKNSTGITPTQINEDASSGQYVTFDSPIVGKIYFGGNKDDGNGPTITVGTGVPSASEPNGSLFLRKDGGATTTLYVRSGGTWTAK